jgi:hypothetical protein
MKKHFKSFTGIVDQMENYFSFDTSFIYHDNIVAPGILPDSYEHNIERGITIQGVPLITVGAVLQEAISYMPKYEFLSDNIWSPIDNIGNIYEKFLPIQSDLDVPLTFSQFDLVRTDFDIETMKKTMPDWLAKAIERIDLIRNLPQNWDSYGAPAPNKQLCDRLERLLFRMREIDLPDPFISPVSDGSIYLSMTNNNKEMEIELENPTSRFAKYRFIEKDRNRTNITKELIDLENQFRDKINDCLLNPNEVIKVAA